MPGRNKTARDINFTSACTYSSSARPVAVSMSAPRKFQTLRDAAVEHSVGRDLKRGAGDRSGGLFYSKGNQWRGPFSNGWFNKVYQFCYAECVL